MGGSVRKRGGPRTKRGKAAAKFNGLTHGATALTVPPGEQAAYRDHRQGVVEAYHPANAVEEFLCDRIALLMWRLKRLDAWEAFQLERLRREAVAHAAFNETPEPSSYDAATLVNPEARYAHVRPEVMTMEQARVEIERITGEQAWRYLRDDEAISELEKLGAMHLEKYEAIEDLSDPPTLVEVRKRCGGDELDNPMLGVVHDLHGALEAWGVDPGSMALAVLGREPTEEETEAMADAVEWEWEADHLVRLWKFVDRAAGAIEGGKPASSVVHAAALKDIVAGVRLQGIAQRVRLLMADSERSGLVLAADSEAKHHRYDANLERSLFKAMHELEALQEKHQGGAAPLARVEIHGDERRA